MATRRIRSAHNRAVRLSTLQLEDRSVPAVLVGLTADDQLVTFDSANPAAVTKTATVTGLSMGDTLVGIAYRPATGQLYGVSTADEVFTLDPATGAATEVGTTAFTPALSGAAFGVDFDPTTDQLRVVSDQNQSVRLDPTTGQVVGTDTNPTFDPTSYAGFFDGTPPDPQIVAAAYTSDLDPTGTQKTATLYGIDSNLDALVTIGGTDGSPSANGGQTFVVGPLGFDASSQTAFGIEPLTDMAFAADGSDVYSVNLTTGATNKLGTTTGTGNLLDLAVAPPAAGAGTFGLSASTFAFGADRKPLAVTVTRTGGSTGAATVDFATSDGTAVGGKDYLPANGTLTFAAGQTSQMIFLNVPNGTSPPSAAKTFNLTLSNATGGALGTTSTTATVTIPAVAAPAPTAVTHFVAVAAGSGDPTIVLYDPISGNEVASFAAFESGFSSGVTVATGDVNGDGIDDIIVGSGSGGGPRVRVFDGASVLATSATGTGTGGTTGTGTTGTGTSTGTGTGTGGTTGTGTGTGAGGTTGTGTGTTGTSGTGTTGTGSTTGTGTTGTTGTGTTGTGTTATTPTLIADFFAYESSFRGGVNVAAGDVNGDGFDDVIVGSGNGGGPRVRVFDGATLTSAAQTTVADFFAYEDSFRGGVNVGAGVFNADGKADILAGAGIGGGPRVEVFDGSTLGLLANYFAYDSSFRNGVLVATGDLNGDGVNDVVTGAGAGGGPNVRAFAGTTQTQLTSFFAFDSSQTGGVRVAVADFGADGTPDIVAGTGTGAAASVAIYSLAGTVEQTLNPFPGATGGVYVG